MLVGLMAELDNAAAASRQAEKKSAGKGEREEAGAEAAISLATEGPRSVASVAEAGGTVLGPKSLLSSGGKSKDAGSTSAVGNSGTGVVGTVSLKHVYEIAKIKQTETRLAGLSLEGLCKSVIAQAGSIGVAVVP